MKNKLIDLNNHLFAELERLSDEDLKGEELKEELKRARAVKDIGSVIVKNANVMLQGQKFIEQFGGTFSKETSKILIGYEEAD